MAPRRRCPTCGSKQWHKEPSSGRIACSEGHVLQNYRNETTEITEVGPHAMKKRALKSGRKKKGKRSNADPKLYHGARGRYHYFLCLQLILRQQIIALTELWQLPPEFEIICKDLWALHLALLPDPPPAEPYHHAQENGEDGKDSDGDDSDRERAEEVERADEDSDDEDSELEALMRENSDISSSSDDEGDGVVKPGVGRTKSKAKGRPGYESPISTLAVLVVACWTLRIPVLYRDFSRIIESYELPYLDVVMRLPGSIVQHLTKHNIQALCPPHAPRTIKIHSVSSRLAGKLHVKYGIYTPEANGASMLWRITKYMGGTPVLYRLTKRVASVLSVPLTLDSSLAPGLEQLKATDELGHRHDNAPTEVGLLASLIIVVKMVYGLDGTTRWAADGDDVACGLASAKEYLEMMEKLAEEDRQEDKYDSRKMMRVGDMTTEEMDEYIGFCSEILKGAKRSDRRDGGNLGCRASTEGTTAIGDGVRAGEEYKIWSARDVEGAPAAEFGKVLGRGAEVAGVSGTYLGGVVESFERRLVRWWHRRRRVMTSSASAGVAHYNYN